MRVQVQLVQRDSCSVLNRIISRVDIRIMCLVLQINATIFSLKKFENDLICHLRQPSY